MTTNPRKSSTDVDNLARISDIISKMPRSAKDHIASPSGGANKQTNDASHTLSLADQTGLGVITPNPDASKSAIDGTVRPGVNPKGTDLDNPRRRPKRVKVKPKTSGSAARDSSLDSTPPASVPPWYPPHFYPPWFLPPYQFPYPTPPAHHPSQIDPRATSRPFAPKPSTRFRSTKTQQENPENNRPAWLEEERTERNLLPDFEQAGSENSERDEV